MAKVKITGHASGTGVLTVTAPNTSSDRTITLPDSTGTILDENSSLPAANLTGTVADARISTLTASKLTGALPAISGASLTGLSSGGLVHLASATASADSTIKLDNFDIDSYDSHLLVISDWQVSTAAIPEFEIIESGGSANITTGYYHEIQDRYYAETDDTINTISQNGTSQVQLMTEAMFAGSTINWNGHIWFHQMQKAGDNIAWNGHFTTGNTASHMMGGIFYGWNSIHDADGYDGIQFQQSTGTITTGNFDIYGFARS